VLNLQAGDRHELEPIIEGGGEPVYFPRVLGRSRCIAPRFPPCRLAWPEVSVMANPACSKIMAIEPIALHIPAPGQRQECGEAEFPVIILPVLF